MIGVLLVGGFVLLVFGAEGLVRGGVRLAAAAGVSPLVIGLTVVAFGTSAPELAVSVGAGLGGQGDIALGNVVGSNILNVLLILGVSALIVPLAVARQLVRLDMPLMIGVSCVVMVLALDGRLGRLEGLLLFAGLVAYLAWSIVMGRRQGRAVVAARPGLDASRPSGWRWWLVSLLLVVAGLFLLVGGARLMVEGAASAARALGVSELVIGLTVIAIGTSLPEAATSVLAAVRGQRDIAVGNVVGSNLFNLLGVLGLTAAASPAGVPVAPAALRFDLPVMLAVALVCLPIFISDSTISRAEGALLLTCYGFYLAYLVLGASGHEAQEVVGTAALCFVVPLTGLGLGHSAWVWIRRRART
ncbi:MAG TPA: calcium/sodium antiporter [Thermoanaerobaculaceae bacterium]|nr:calcium/sodium antiporter [Thermoanaerobaculaceae bacterium]HRS14618.1 calcium/sodium antiporter [Thermoanaerobaculaceae bacterium]